MCGTEPCLSLYAKDAVHGAPLDAASRRCREEPETRARAHIDVHAREGRVRLEARLFSGTGFVLDLAPSAARSVAACLEQVAEAIREAATDDHAEGAEPVPGAPAAAATAGGGAAASPRRDGAPELRAALR